MGFERYLLIVWSQIMITFDPVPIGDSTFQMHELSFEQCLKISIIAPNLNEKDFQPL